MVRAFSVFSDRTDALRIVLFVHGIAFAEVVVVFALTDNGKLSPLYEGI